MKSILAGFQSCTTRS